MRRGRGKTLCARCACQALLGGRSTSPLGVAGALVGRFDHVGSPDGPMSAEEEAIAALLSQQMVEKIDKALLSHAKLRGRKVAVLVGLTMMDPEVRVPGLPDLYYANRVRVLVERGLLVAEGDLDYMRYSEVRLP
jgi:hypothetical protein